MDNSQIQSIKKQTYISVLLNLSDQQSSKTAKWREIQYSVWSSVKCTALLCVMASHPQDFLVWASHLEKGQLLCVLPCSMQMVACASVVASVAVE